MSTQHFAYGVYANRGCGVVTVDNFTPLTLSGCFVEVEIRGNCARVNVRYEYSNYTGKDQRVIAAYALPVGWDLMVCRADYAGDSMQSEHRVSTPLTTAVPNASATSLATLPGLQPNETVTTVATQRLPWVVGVGTNVLVGATYYVPLDTLRSCCVFRMHIPAELIPSTIQPPPSTMGYASLFDMKWPKKIPAGLTIDARCDMFVPLSAKVEFRHSGDTEALSDTQVEYVGDSSFRLNYTSPFPLQHKNGFDVTCRLRETAEPLRFFLERDEGDLVCEEDRYALTLCFSPQLNDLRESIVNAELVFVVDSHSGYASAAMAKAIFVALHGVQDTVFVNIVVVSAKEDLLLSPRGSQQISRLGLEQLAAFIAEARPQAANTGVSHLHRAVRAVMTSDEKALCGPVPRGYVRHVVVLSDEGAAAHATETIVAATRQRHNMCFSAVALLYGGFSNVPMLHLLAREGGGAFGEASNAEELQEALVSVLSQVLVPTMTDIALRVKEPGVRLCGSTTPLAVPQGSQQFLYGLASASLQTVNVCLTGRVGSRVIEYVGTGDANEIFFTSVAEPRNPLSVGLFHLSALSARMRYHLDERDKVARLSEAEIREVARLSCVFMLPCPFTEMLQTRPTIANRSKADASNAANEPQNLIAFRYTPRSWLYARIMQLHWNDRVARGLVNCCPQQADQNMKHDVAVVKTSLMSAVKLNVPDVKLRQPLSGKEFIQAIVEEVVESVMSGKQGIARLATLQSTDGSFTLNATLALHLGCTLEQLLREAPFSCTDVSPLRDQSQPEERLWATALVAAVIEKQSHGAAGLALRKAMLFLRSNNGDKEPLQRARGLVSRLSIASVMA
ncbi:hypothetical protein TRVL_03941 [Trypanosoma vivax]|nr:hypothetical protein TRVL_03941 [Trypanosoma vivax]